MRTKTLWYNVSGALKDREDVEQLRALIKAEKPSISIDQVNWNLRFTSDGSKLVGNDRGLFKSDYEEDEIKQ